MDAKREAQSQTRGGEEKRNCFSIYLFNYYVFDDITNYGHKAWRRGVLIRNK